MRVRGPSDVDVRYRICFVCTANLCRSVAAEYIFENMLHTAGLSDTVAVWSAGTSRWRRDGDMDPRTRQWLTRRGYDDGEHRMRQFEPAWFAEADLVIALDRTHRRSLSAIARDDSERSRIALLCSLDAALAPLQDIPDPYSFDDEAFDRVMETIEQACRSLLTHVTAQLD